jgi:hypothetical protein
VQGDRIDPDRHLLALGLRTSRDEGTALSGGRSLFRMAPWPILEAIEAAVRCPRTLRPMAPIFFDPHVCKAPPTVDLIGARWTSSAGVACAGAWSTTSGKDGSLLGPSWILL